MPKRSPNGAWPYLDPVPPPLPEVGSEPSLPELTRALGSTLIVFGHQWPRIVQALEYLREWTEEHELAHHEGDTPPPPSYRSTAASSNELAHLMAQDIVSQYEAELSENPSIPPPADLLMKRASDRIRIEMMRIRQKERANARRSRRRLLFALATAFVAALGAFAEHMLK